MRMIFSKQANVPHNKWIQTLHSCTPSFPQLHYNAEEKPTKFTNTVNLSYHFQFPQSIMWLIRCNPINAQSNIITTTHQRPLQIPGHPFPNQIQTQLQRKKTNKKTKSVTYPDTKKDKKPRRKRKEPTLLSDKPS